MAVLAISLAACTGGDNIQQPTTANGDSNQSIPFSATIQGESATRGLTESSDGSYLIAKWEKGEQVALVHGETIDVVKVTSVDDSGNATIEGDIHDAIDGESVYVVYVGTSPGENMSDYVDFVMNMYADFKEADPTLTAIPVEPLLRYTAFQILTQEGTLDYVAKYLDIRYDESTIAIKNSFATFSSAVKPSSIITVVKVTLKDGAGNDYQTKKFFVKDEDGRTNATVTPKEAAKVLYIGLAPVANATYVFEAEDDNGITTCTKTGVTLSSAMFYTSTLSMGRPVTGVTLNKSSLELTEGDTFTLEATVAPTDATNKEVTWESSKATVASVDQNGKVTALNEGDATITVTTKDGKKTATCTVKVKLLPSPAISNPDTYNPGGNPFI